MATHVAGAAEPGAAPADGQAAAAGVPILASKITAPGVPDWAVQRPRIIRLIAEGARSGPLTVVTGPPGAGKTMALASWAAAESSAVAWVALDDWDNQPGVFWSYVVAALRAAGCPAGAGSRSRVPAAARVGAGGPASAGDAGRR